MKIDIIEIENYKGFENSGPIALDHKWNVVIGQNNAGKTAFLEAFRLHRNGNYPHRSIKYPLEHLSPQTSRFSIDMAVDRKWLKRAFVEIAGAFHLPISGHNEDGQVVAIDPNTFWDGAPLALSFDAAPGGVVFANWPSHRLFKASRKQRHVTFSSSGADRMTISHSGEQSGSSDSLPDIMRLAFPQYIYVFEAKRFALGECDHDDTRILLPDAANLPAVLLKLTGNPSRFRQFTDNVKSIFPRIQDVTITPKGAKFEIRLWHVDPKTEREDLAVPLNESGTGVAQVLAILYVAMTNEPGVIAIDEPNSFLHPGAAKALIQILKRYDHHQYIISTHSPEVIAAAQPATLHLIQFDGEQSRVQTFNDAEVSTKRRMLEEVGASMADVLATERVIWVEGPTERECFDLIVEREFKGPIVGLGFVALRNTGDFESKNTDSEAVLDIYDALSNGGSILPTSVAFSFDREEKTDAQISDLSRRCKGRAYVLPRRMTENYLLCPAAIAAVLQGLGEATADVKAVEALMRKSAPSRMPKGATDPYGSDDYFRRVDGARLLDDVFHEATDGRHQYRKVRDAVELLRAQLDIEPQAVAELVAHVGTLVKRAAG